MFKPVKTEKQIKQVVDLAGVIWHEHYSPIIGAAQVSYMLENMHSEAKIAEEIAEHAHQYFLINQDGRDVGYMSVFPDDGVLIVSKLYVLSTERSRGIGRRAISYVIDLATKLNLNAIRLNVSRRNSGSIAAYEKMGFEKTDTLKVDIGGGFSMDDYQMELSLQG